MPALFLRRKELSSYLGIPESPAIALLEEHDVTPVARKA